MGDKRLLEACEIVVADSGKEDDALVKALYDRIQERYVSKGKTWNYGLLDRVYANMLKEA